MADIFKAHKGDIALIERRSSSTSLTAGTTRWTDYQFRRVTSTTRDGLVKTVEGYRMDKLGAVAVVPASVVDGDALLEACFMQAFPSIEAAADAARPFKVAAR